MPTKPQSGDVWFADLGITEESRPVLVLSFPEEDDARSLTIVSEPRTPVPNAAALWQRQETSKSAME